MGDEEDPVEDISMRFPDSIIEQQKMSYQNLKKNAQKSSSNHSKSNILVPDSPQFQEGQYSKTLGKSSVIRQMLANEADSKREHYINEKL